MSSILPVDGTALPPVDQAQLPADVRKAGPKAEQLYETALSFEQVMLSQLTQAMSATTGMDGSDDSSDDSDDSSDDSTDATDSTSSAMMQMLPGALSQTMTSAGGVGIADELYQSMAARAGITDPSSTAAGS
ncbi:MAG TPA: hypothetical protein VH063_19085 [Gaiellaceae bacterium]|jgi:Rod binding domain-containing protein|nr:hypothetical protein [Gaiellaceae bacterium]